MSFSVDRSLLNPVSLQALAQGIQKLFNDLSDHLDGTPNIQNNINQNYPRTAIGDLLLSQTLGSITFKFVTANNQSVDVTIGPSITSLNTNYLGQTSTAALPTNVEYPNSGNWGFHTNTTTSKIYIVINFNGVIKKVELT